MNKIFAALLISFIVSNAFADVSASAPAAASGPAVIAKPATSIVISATITQVAEDKNSIVVDAPNKAKNLTLTLGKDVQDQIGRGLTLSQGDKISIKVDENNVISSLKPETTVLIHGETRFIFLGMSAALLVIFSIGMLWGAGQKGIFCFSSLIVGEDNRYSNSKFQIVLWFFVVIFTYLATVLLRWYEAGGDYLLVNIPQNLLLLSGMSALTFAGAKAITTSKTQTESDKAKKEIDAATKAAANAQTGQDKAAAEAAVSAAQQKAANIKYKPPGTENFFKDLLQNDNGQVDFGDFQMLVVTFLAVGVYLLQVYHFLGHMDFLKVVSLPDVDSTILSVFGLGQGAYLAKKAAGSAGQS